jgi:hypothetical protein
MTFRKCNPLYGYRWFRRGLTLFMQQPWQWLALVGMIFFATLLLVTLPILGLVTVYLIMPGISAGLMLGAQDVAHDRPLRFPALIAGFKQAPRPLVGIGGVNFLATLLFSLLLSLGWGPEFQRLIELASSPATDVQVMEEALHDMTVPSLLNLAFLFALSMANWFAPALVVFRGQAAGPAMLASVKASLANAVPFLVYGLLFLAVVVVLSVVLGFLLTLLQHVIGQTAGIGMLLVFPVVCALFAQVLATMYVSYGDVFEAQAAKPQAAQE